MENGRPRNQTWRYLSCNNCRAYNTQTAGHALRFDTRQLNRPNTYPGETANQLEALNEAGYFFFPIAAVAEQLVFPSLDESAASLEGRVRAYLAVNCAQCHQPGGPVLGFWNAQAHLSLEDTGLVNGELVANYGNAVGRVIVPRSVQDSMLLIRLLCEPSNLRMPPIGSHELDDQAIKLVRAWIVSLSGVDLEPITFESWVSQFELLDAKAAADPDSDGLTNLHEFLADTNPGQGGDFSGGHLCYNRRLVVSNIPSSARGRRRPVLMLNPGNLRLRCCHSIPLRSC